VTSFTAVSCVLHSAVSPSASLYTLSLHDALPDLIVVHLHDLLHRHVIRKINFSQRTTSPCAGIGREWLQLDLAFFTADSRKIDILAKAGLYVGYDSPWKL